MPDTRSARLKAIDLLEECDGEREKVLKILQGYEPLPDALDMSGQMALELAKRVAQLNNAKARALEALEELFKPSEAEEKARTLVANWLIAKEDQRLNAKFCGPRSK